MGKGWCYAGLEWKAVEDFRSSNYRWLILAILWLAHVIQFFNFSSLGVFAPFFKKDMNLSSAQIGFFDSAVSLGRCLSTVPGGLITDLMGIRVILPLSIGLMGFFWILFSFSSSYAGALLILLIYGLAAGVISPAASKGVRSWFPVIGRATAMGVKQTGVNLGGILAGVLLPSLALNFSWRKSLLMSGISEVVCAALIYQPVKEPSVRTPEDLPFLNWKKVLTIVLNRNILILGGTSFLFFACQFCFSTYLTLFLIQELQYSIVQAGLYFALAYFTGAAGRILWSIVSDYFLRGRRKGILLLTTWIELLSLLILFLSSFFPATSKFLLVAVLAFGLGGIGSSAIFLTILAESTGKESTGIATATGFFFGYIGSLLCTPLFGYVIDITGVYGYGWLFLTFCAAASILLLSRFQESVKRTN